MVLFTDLILILTLNVSESKQQVAQHLPDQLLDLVEIIFLHVKYFTTRCIENQQVQQS